MSYTKQTWQTGDTITAEKLNHIEDGLDDVNRQLNDLDTNKQDAPSTDGTAGQVLGLDSNLDPVWVDQTGGGGDTSNCAPIIINTASGDIASFADGADNRQIRKIVGTIVPVQSGSGDPSPDNVRPISGWTGANISIAGENLYGGTYNTRFPLFIPSGTKVCVSGDSNLTTINYYRADGTRISYYSTIEVVPNSTRRYRNFKVSEDVYYVMFNGGNAPNSQVAIGYDNYYYEPYHGQALPINWQTEAGTIYGGTVTLNEDGSADVISTYCVYNISSTQWSYSSGATVWYITRASLSPLWDISGNAEDGVIRDIVCSAYKTETYNNAVYQSYAPCIAERRYNANWLAVQTGSANVRPVDCQVKMKLATPQTYHFDNIGQLKTFLGTNNVWCDTGAITECDYPADTKTYVDENGGDVTDVQINGTSILSNGVANIPMAGAQALGTVKVSEYTHGLLVSDDGTLKVQNANPVQIKGGNEAYRPIVPGIQDAAAFYGLAKAAGDTTQYASSNAVGAYTEAAKSAIHEMLNGSVAVSGTTPTIAAKSGITYVCGEVATLDITPPASGIFDVIFTSGSTPTVLTATGVTWMNGFDPTELEANKTYEINILNGLGVAAWT